jgi:predicted ATP-binding protein involved in virulence
MSINNKVPSLYIKSLQLRNIRTFGENVELKLEKPDGTLPQWTLMLGDNGIGKSTLLHCIAWMKPNLSDPEGPGEEILVDNIQPNISNEENETIVSLVRKSTSANEEAHIKALFVANREFDKIEKIKNKSVTCETAAYITLKGNQLYDFKQTFNSKNDVAKLFSSHEIIIYAYSALRSSGKQNFENPELSDTIPSFIAEKTELYDASEILHTANYAALGSDKKEKKKYQDYLHDVKAMLVSILPDIDGLNDIEITVPKLVLNKMRPGEILVTTKYGKKVPMEDLSLGYRTVIAWTVDLSWRMFNRGYQTSSKPLEQPAIVLIDEIDLHLHPVWQRQIMANLSKHFPKIQFIATAHSPLMVQAAFKSNYAVLKLNNETAEIENNPQGIDGWRVDQILTSEFFGLKTARGEEYEKLLNEHNRLSSKKKITSRDRKKLDDIDESLSKLPTGENPKEIEYKKLIAKVVENIKKSNKIIKL